MNTSFSFRWLGVAGIELRVDAQVLAVDPYFTRIPFWQTWLGRIHPNRALIRGLLPRCDNILVTHAHWDHLLDVPEAAQFTGARVYGSANTCRLVSSLGVPGEQLHEIRSGDELDLGRFNIHVLPAEHIKLPAFKPGELPARLQPPLRARDYRMDSCFSFLISVDDCRLLVAAGVRADQTEAADILLVNPLHSFATLQALLQRVHPKVVIPNHWDDLWRPLSKPMRPMLKPPTWSSPLIGRIDLAKFERAVAQIDPRIRVLIPELFTYNNLYDILGAL